MNTPNGYSEIDALFGNPSNPDGSVNLAWQHAHIVAVAPPAGWQLYYQASAASLTPIKALSMHQLLKDGFQTVLNQVWAFSAKEIGGNASDDAIRKWLHDFRLDVTAGCFNYRPSSGNGKVLSLHSYGIAIDWDPLNNPHKLPLSRTLPDWWFNIWAQNGWSDGRHFKTPDPMHVQFATGA
jgi:hypothetical protein